MAVNPTGADMKAFLASDPEQPVVMLNLLRFAPGGAERYDAYLAHFRPCAERVGASIVYFGHGTPAVVAEPGQEWDAVLLVSYPSRRAFSDMVRDPDYQEGTHLRTEALVEATHRPRPLPHAPAPPTPAPHPSPPPRPLAHRTNGTFAR